MSGRWGRDKGEASRAVVFHLDTEGCDPTAEIAVELIDLVLDGAVDELVLVARGDRPVVIDPVIEAHVQEIVRGEERIVIEVLVADIDLEILGSDVGEAGVDLVEPMRIERGLRGHVEADPWKRIEGQAVVEV